MYSARLNRVELETLNEIGDDPPIISNPPVTIWQKEIDGRTVLQVQIAPDVLETLESTGNEIEIQIIPDDTLTP